MDGPIPEPPREATTRLGSTVGGRYPLLEVLGTGGMGAVFRSVQPHVERTVAIKVLHSPDLMGDATGARFLREAKAIAALDHPSVVTLYDFGVDPDGTAFMVMEHVRGATLGSQFDLGRVPPGLLLDLVLEVLGALEAAHALGVVHRDLKPDNVMLLAQPKAHAHVKVLDFGLAKLVQEGASQRALTAAGMVCGTPAYISPEQVLGQDADARSDLYAVGVLLYEGLTGKRPFSGDLALDVLQAHVSAPLPDLPEDFPDSLQALLEQALAKEPGERFSSATEMAEAVRDARDSLPEVFAAGDTLQTPIPPAVARMMLQLEETGETERSDTALDELGEEEARHDTAVTPPPEDAVRDEIDRMPTRPREAVGFAPTIAPSVPWLDSVSGPKSEVLPDPGATMLDDGAYAQTAMALEEVAPTPLVGDLEQGIETRPAVPDLSAADIEIEAPQRHSRWGLILVFVIAAGAAAGVLLLLRALRGS